MTKSLIYYLSHIWTIIGSVNGHFLVLYIDKTASTSKALAPKPYTVSVGKATNLFYHIFSPQIFKFSSFNFNIFPILKYIYINNKYIVIN